MRCPASFYQHVLRDDDTDAFPFISARVTELMGAAPAMIQRSSLKFWERVHPEDRGRVRDAILAEARATRASRSGDKTYEQRFDAEFRVQTPDGHRLQFSQSFHIGRDENCEVRIQDVHVSRRHAVVLLAGGSWSLRDLQSANGIYADGARLGPRFSLRDFHDRFLSSGNVPPALIEEELARDWR